MKETCVILAIALWSCGGSSSGSADNAQNASGKNTPSLGASSDSGAPTTAPTSMTSTSNSLPPDPGNDPGTPEPGATNAFSNAPPYQEQLPSLRANDLHPSSVVLQDCLSCHDGAHSPAPLFDFAGTMWDGDDTSQPSVGTEIRQLDSTGIAYSTYTDQDGNFWHIASAPLELPSLSGVRNANGEIIGMLNGTSCNRCHTSTFKLHSPVATSSTSQ